MPQGATGAAAAAPVKNPARETILRAEAGGRTEVVFDFVNDAPFVARFHLEADGLPAGWVDGTGPERAQTVAASGGGSLHLWLTPPPDAAFGDYDLRTRVVCDGSPVEADLPLIMRVDSLAEKAVQTVAALPAVAADESPSTAPVPADEPFAVAANPQVRTNGAVAFAAPEPPPAEEAAASAPAAPEPVTRPVAPVSTPRPVTPQRPELVYSPPANTDVAATAPPLPTPRPVPAAATTAHADDLPVVDYQARTTTEIADDAEDDAELREPSVVSPQEGAALAVKPGETLLLRFPFTNETRATQTYVIDEDRSLEPDWITLVQDQVNLTRNGSGEVSVRLSPPANAEPGDYPFTVRIGPLGGVLTPRQLTLSVQAIPAVRVQAKNSKLTIGPWGKTGDFNLTVDSIGNCDTAFRVAVKSPEAVQANAQAAEENAPRVPDDVYETPQWRYLFDKEMDSLESLSPTRPPQPDPIRLRVQRKGWWWLGWRESHPIRVAAVPVTDPANGGKTGNVVDLTAVRWRLLPFPGWVLVPLTVLALMFLSSGPTDLTVAGATYVGPDNTHYVVGEPTNDRLGARLQWSAANPLALLRLSATGDRYEERPHVARSPQNVTAELPRNQSSVYRVYRVDPAITKSGREAKVRFIRGNRQTPLEVRDARGARLSGETINLVVPPSGRARLQLANRAQSDLAINYYVAKRPGSAFIVENLNNDGSLTPEALNGGVKSFNVKRASGSDGSDGGESDDTSDELVIITSDANRPVVRVNLKYGSDGGTK